MSVATKRHQDWTLDQPILFFGFEFLHFYFFLGIPLLEFGGDLVSGFRTESGFIDLQALIDRYHGDGAGIIALLDAVLDCIVLIDMREHPNGPGAVLK